MDEAAKKVVAGLRDALAGRFTGFRTPDLEYRAFPFTENPGKPWLPAVARPPEWKEMPSGHILWVRPVGRP
jgi:hypothetical protein